MKMLWSTPSLQNQSARAGFLRRADSLASSTEMAMFRRVSEPHEPQLRVIGMADLRIGVVWIAKAAFQWLSPSSWKGMAGMKMNTLHIKVKAQAEVFPVKNLTQRRPLSARSYSTESCGASQTRPVSARPTMATLLEKIPSDYNLGNYGNKPSDNSDIKARPTPVKGEESCGWNACRLETTAA